MRSRMSGMSGRMSRTRCPRFFLAPANSRFPTRMQEGVEDMAALASVGTLSMSGVGAGGGALRIVRVRSALRDPLLEFDGVLARAIRSPHEVDRPPRKIFSCSSLAVDTGDFVFQRVFVSLA